MTQHTNKYLRAYLHMPLTPPKLKVFYLKPTRYVGVVGIIAMEARIDNAEGAVKK